MTFYQISALVNAIASTIVFIVAIIRNPKSGLNRSLSYFAFSIAFWSYTYFFWQLSKDAKEVLFLCRVLMAGAIFIPPTFLHFSVSLIGERKQYSKIVNFWYLVSVVFLFLDFTPLFVKDVRPRLSFLFWPTAGIAYGPFLVMFAGLTIYAHVLMYKAYKKLSGVKRNQIKYVFLGTAIGFIGGSTNYPLWYDIAIPPFGNILVAVYVLLVAYAIIKYHLMDIKMAVTRAGIFVFVYMFVLGLPFWFGIKTGLWGWAVALMGFFASLGPFIYNLLRRRAEDVFFAEQKRYQKALKNFASTVIFIKDIKKLGQKVVANIISSIELSFCAIYLKENNDFHLIHYKSNLSTELPSILSAKSELISSLKDTNVPLLGEYLSKLNNIRLGLVAPLFLKQKICGVIILGQKKAGFYTDTDLDAFTILANQTSLALSEIYYFEEYQKTIEDKYKLALEKERLESAFEIAEAYRHEVGNAVQMISLNADSFLSDTSYNPSQEELLNSLRSISRNADKAQNVLDAVSSYNKKAKTKFKAVALDKIVTEAVKKQEIFISDKGITLKTEMEDEIQVLGNENLPEAVRYLIEGAVQAIEYFLPKEKLISVKLISRNNSAVLEVADTANAVLSDTLYKGVGIERGKEGGKAGSIILLLEE